MVSLSLVDVEGHVPSSEDLSIPEGILPLPIGSLQIPVSVLHLLILVIWWLTV